MKGLSMFLDAGVILDLNGSKSINCQVHSFHVGKAPWGLAYQIHPPAYVVYTFMLDCPI